MVASQSQQCSILDFSQPLQIAVFGLDEHIHSSLEKTLRLTGKHCATLVSKSDAQAGIFDFDNAETALCWASYRRLCPDLPTIVLGSCNPNIPDTFYISKPIRVSQLKQAIRAIKQSRADKIKTGANS